MCVCVCVCDCVCVCVYGVCVVDRCVFLFLSQYDASMNVSTHLRNSLKSLNDTFGNLDYLSISYAFILADITFIIYLRTM